MPVGKTRWIAVVLLSGAAGCAVQHPEGPQLQFDEMPPAVRAAFLANYPSAEISRITCQANGNQYVYLVNWLGIDRKTHTVVLNEGGDQIDRY